MFSSTKLAIFAMCEMNEDKLTVRLSVIVTYGKLTNISLLNNFNKYSQTNARYTSSTGIQTICSSYANVNAITALVS